MGKKTAYEKWKEKYSGTTTQKTSNNNDKGKQSNSAPSTRTTETEKSKPTTTYEKWKSKYSGGSTSTTTTEKPKTYLQDRFGVTNSASETTKTPTARTTRANKYATDTTSAYADAKNKVKNTSTPTNEGNALNKVTITSDLSDKERKARIKEIKSEMQTLNYRLQGLSRATSYGTDKDYITKTSNETRKQIDELSEELKSLERVGTYTVAELKQFEIDDAKEEKSKLPNYNSTAWVSSPSEVEAHIKNAQAHSEADRKISNLEREKELYENIAEFSDVVNEDNFTGQWRANYRSNELSRQADKAMSEYIRNPTEENRQIAYAYDAFAKEYMKNNAEALDDENVELGWLSKSLAGYLPQFKDQIGPELIGGGIGLAFGSAVGQPTVGASIGAGMGSYAQMYDVMQGSVYRTLIAEGVDEQTALEAAQDEALISSLIEGGGTAISWMVLGGGKALSAIGSAAKSSVAKGSTNAATKAVASLATKTAASKAVGTAAQPLWKSGLKVAGGVVGDAASEYVEEFTQQGVSIANKERALNNTDESLITGSAKLIKDAVTGKNPEALAEMHEAGKEGWKIGLMMGGSGATVNNIVTHYANAKTVNQQNEFVDSIIEDEESLTALIEEGKASGEGTVSAKIAEKVEQAKTKGKVTREQVKQLIASNEVYIEAEQKTNTNPQQTTTEPDTIEQAARDVVASKNKMNGFELLEARKRGEVTAEILDTLSQANVEITAEEVKKVTGFGEEGAKIVADYTNEDGATFSQVVRMVTSSYMTGTKQPDLDIKKVAHTFQWQAQADAYTAGQKDRVMQNLSAKENAKNVVVNEESGFSAEGLPSDVTESQIETLDLMAKSVGVKSYVKKGLKGNAELNRVKGEVPIDFDFEREIGEGDDRQSVSIVFHAAHEMAMHRVVELAPEEGTAFVYALYNHLAGNESLLVSTLADQKRSAYAEQGVDISLADAMEEVSANNILTLYNGDEAKFHKAIERIANGKNEKAKQGLKKYIDFLNTIIRKIREVLSGKSAEERAKIQEELNEIAKLRDMFESAFAKAVENRKAMQSQKAQKNTDSESDVNYSLSPAKRERLEKTILNLNNANIKKVAGNKEIKILTDHFSVNKAIYSKKGRTAREVNARIKAISEFETIIRQSMFSHTDTDIVKLDNAAKKNVIAMHYFKTNYNGFDIEIVVRDKGKRQFLYEIKFIENKKNSQQSMPNDIGSTAPKGDVENDIKIPQNPESVKRDFSLKTSFRTDGMTDNEIEDAQNVISNLKSYALSSKYLDGFASYTTERIVRELYNSSNTSIDYATSYVTWVNPIDFIYATTASEEKRVVLAEEAGELDVERLAKETQPIYLRVDFETGEIIGHEGRHRMLALQKSGIEKVAVVIEAENNDRYNTKPIDFMSLKGQRYTVYQKGTDMYISNVLPLSQRYADTARELFTAKPKSGIQYSLKDIGYTKAVKNGDMETAQRMVDKAAKKAGAVTDNRGNAKHYYHGTVDNFNSFEAEKSRRGTYGFGFYFANHKGLAQNFANYQSKKNDRPATIKDVYIMTSKLATRNDHKITAEQVSRFAQMYGLKLNKNTFGYTDSIEEWVSNANDSSILVSLQEYVQKQSDYDTKTLLKDLSDVFGYDGIKDSDETVLWDNRLVKLADPVTYDDNGNVIPLSKRFDTKKNDDTRYSLKKGDTNKLSTEEKKAVDALGEGAETITNKNGEMLIATNKNKNTVMYSIKTYKNGGKVALEKALRANGHTEEEIAETLSYVDDAADYLTILAAGYAKSHNYTALSNHLIADVITNVKTGKQVISSIVNNGEYPVNIDLALICKKRVAYMNLMNRLIEDGIFDKVNYDGEAIAKVNDLLRTDGFETACLGCFVESRRLQFQAWAETIVSEWNTEVDKRKKNAGNFNFADGKAKLTDAEMDALAEELKNAGKKNAQGNLNLGRGSVQTKMGRLLDKVPSLQKHLTVADLLTPNGLTALRAYDSNLFSIVKSRYGAASPKIVQDYNPYASEIAMMTFSSVKNITSNAVKGADAYRRKVINEMGGKPVKQKDETAKAFKERKAEFNAKVEDEAIRRYLYDIGGARIQSFSDFMIENVFDYIQIFADLSAKRLPLHGYTKEIIALRLFGMTGAKWNGSWIAHVDRDMGKEYAGLLPASEAKDGNAILVHTDDGDYAIGFDDYARYKATNKKTFIQSIGMKDMLALQLDPRYSSYVGSITIGVSDKQILAMLDSPYFRFVIPYHSSGMLPQFAKLVGVDLYNDYTDYQNTKVKQWYDAYGEPCEPISDVTVDTSYNFNAEFQKTGDAKKAADNYLKWCSEKHPVYDKNKKRVGYVTFSPKFSDSPYGTDFSKHENYYKMLEDFNSYDNITEEPAVQGAVTMNFPSEQNQLSTSEMEAYKDRLRETGIFSEKEIEKYSGIANKTFKELIADEVEGRAEYQKAQSPKWETTVKNVEKMLLDDHQREMYSLKGTNNTFDASPKGWAKFSKAVEDLRNGEAGASERLAKYVEKGLIPSDTYNELIETYGAIPIGEKPHREIRVPQKTEKNKKVSQTVRTILEAKATPDEALPTIEKMVEDGVFSYDAYTDKRAITDAEDYIKEYGWAESLNDWFDDVEKGVVSKQHTAMGWALYNNAVNTAATTTSETERKTAVQTSLMILDAMVRHQRSAAQALQATRILKKLSPETQLYGMQKSVSAFQNELNDKYGEKAPNLKIDEELAEQFLNAKTPEERSEIEAEIYKDIGRQMPSRFIDKWNAWRYLAMLGNPRTHVRNIFGNAFFAPVVITKNLTATAIESAVYRLGGRKMLRGKSLVVGNKADRELLKAAWSDYANVADLVSNGGKYNDSAMANRSIEKGRKIFKSKLAAPLEWARKGNSELLEKEDTLFSKPHYAYALAQYCKANNITAEQIKRGKAIVPAREYAIKEAQKATYKDTNAFSQMVSGWGRGNKNEKNVVKKTFNTVIEGILPFRKTPANILVRGVEYSPIGMIKGLTYDLAQVKKGNMQAYEAIDNISAGLTGTGLLGLGVLLAAQGVVRGHGEDEEKEKEFKELMGHQAYSLELPNGESITLDWLAPEALPFFVGVNLWEAKKGSDDKVTLSTILKAVSNISEPMLEMSCLQSLNDLFEGIGYASSNDTSGLVSVLSSAATSYLTQGIPTLLGQTERTGEEERMTTYTEKNGFLTGDMQYTLGKISAKIPFWDYAQIPYIDAWGRKEASGNALKRGLNNFLNPAYTSTIDESDMEKELLRLFEKTGESGVFPSRADKYFTVNGTRKDLTADEYVMYATLKGEKSYKVVSKLVKSKAYKKLSDAEKVQAIEEAYDYANQKAKESISNYEPQSWVGKADEFGSDVGDYISFRAEVNSTKNENGDKISKQEVVDIVLDMAKNDPEAWNMYLSMYDSTGDMYAYDKGIDGTTYMEFLESLDYVDKPTKSGKYGTYTQDEARKAINRLKGLSSKEKAILYQSVNTTWKNNPFR